MGWIADGVADRHFADAGQSNNIAGRSFAYLCAGKALKPERLTAFAFLAGASASW